MNAQKEYELWIECWLSENKPHGRCKEASEQMNKQFPELIIVPGFVYTDWGRREHFWLKDQSGEIVDPTASQFNIIFEYEEWKPGTPVRVGRCKDCGEDILFCPQSLDESPDIDQDFCSESCRNATLAYLNSMC